jgi:nucleotide-binding universal stress UspA family protein
MTTMQLATPPPLAAVTVNTMFSRILLAIDFGPASLGAARWATTHVAPGADAVLMHVMPLADQLRVGGAPATSENDFFDGVAPALVGGLGGFGATLDLASRRSAVRVGRPSVCLAAVANDAKVSLLTLGRRADANRTRVGEPNVIERVARRTSASVLVAPERTTRAPDHIIAAVDESSFAPHVLRVAAQLGRMHEVPLTVLHVLEPVAGAYERVIRSAKHLVSRVGGRSLTAPDGSHVPTSLGPETAKWLLQLGYADISPDSTHIAMGDPVREIVNTAMGLEAPLVVVGLRGADEAPPGSIGSVARELLTRGPMPVLAVNVL